MKDGLRLTVDVDVAVGAVGRLLLVRSIVGVVAVLILVALLLLPASVAPVRMRSVAIVFLSLQLLLSVALLIPFDPSVGTPQLVEFTPWVSRIGLDYRLAVDGLSLPLILINAALTLVSAVCTRDFDQRPRIYFSMLLLISGAVNGAFLADNLLLFVIFYELELIPLWLLIAVWGGANRGYASTKFLIFTAVSGFLILAAFFGLALVSGSVNFNITPALTENLPVATQLVLLVTLLIGFGIKIPLVPFHVWLPDAHTQASTPVSVMLAGVLLKLGTYGLLRFGLGLFQEVWPLVAPWGLTSMIPLPLTASTGWLASALSRWSRSSLACQLP